MASGLSSMPLAFWSGLPGTEMVPLLIAVEPPIMPIFSSRTTRFAPLSKADSPATKAARPLPMTITSKVSAHSADFRGLAARAGAAARPHSAAAPVLIKALRVFTGFMRGTSVGSVGKEFVAPGGV